MFNLAEYDIYDHDPEFLPIDKYLPMGAKPKPAEGLEKRLEADTSGRSKADRGFLEEILSDKAEFLKQILGQIDQQITDREMIKESIARKIDKGICYLRTKLYELDTWQLGKNRNIDTRRAQLDKELEALEAQKRDEARECWRDVALLKKEHREFSKEYRNALRRVKVIFPHKKQK